jgi:hypothetical protein
MSRDSSNKLLSIVNADTPNDVFLFLVSVQWEDGSYSRYVKNYEDIISRGNVYKAGSFSISLPEEPDGNIPTVKFSFNVTELQMLSKLRTDNEVPELTLEVALASDPNIVEVGPFVFDIKGFRVNGPSVEVEAGFEPLLELSVPQIKYSPLLFPGLYSHVRGES